jgi:uncharacterized membrane protein
MTAPDPGRLRWIAILSAIFTAAFPAFIYFGREFTTPSVIALTGALLLLARLLTLPRGTDRSRVAGLGCAIALLAVAAVSGMEILTLMYPTLVNASLMVAFAATLWRPPSLVERLGRAWGMKVDPRGAAYRKWVTAVWSLFFLLNGVIAAVLALRGDLATWAFYTGVLGYLMAGLLMAMELVVRHFYKARLARRSARADCLLP